MTYPETMEIGGETIPYQDWGWTHCDICYENIWDHNIEWSECSLDDREWEFICKACFEVKK